MIGSKVGYIGVGNMASALLSGVLDSGVEVPGNIVIYDVCREKLTKFADMGCRIASSESDLVSMCSTIILAIKPQGFPALLETIKDTVREDQLIISIAAGISIGYIHKALGKTVPVIRALPNTPMQLGLGVTALTYLPPVTELQYEYARKVFSSCGMVEFVEEEKFHRITAVHSSSPAYFFYFVSAMAKSAEAQGIDYKQAFRMIVETMIGSAKMLEESGLTCDELIGMVASKGGTTEASLRVFDSNDLSGIIDSAMRACADRSRELGGE